MPDKTKQFVTDRHGVEVSFDIGTSAPTRQYNGMVFAFSRSYNKRAPKTWVKEMKARLTKQGYNVRIVAKPLYNDVYIRPIYMGRPKW